MQNGLAAVAEDKVYRAESVNKQSSLDRDMLENQDNETFNMQDLTS